MGTESQISLVDYGVRFARSVRWWWVSVPLLAGALAYVVLRLAVTDLAILGRVRSSMEVAALTMTCAAVLVALVGFIVRRRAFTAWLLILASLMAFREWHIVHWASTLAYIGIAALLVASWLNDESVGRRLTAHPVSTFLVLAFLSYAMTRPMDMDVIQTIDPAESPNIAPIPFVEEIVENVGHFFLLLLVIVGVKGPPAAGR